MREPLALSGRVDLYQQIVETAADAIMTLDLQGKVTTWNLGAVRLFGYAASEIVGHYASVRGVPSRPEEMQRLLDTVGQGRRVDDYEVDCARKDGEVIDVSLSLSPIRDRTGVIVGASAIARDVRFRKRTLATLAHYAQELARSNAELQQFAYAASHDLQEPLRMVAGYVQLLARRYEGRLDADADQFIHYAVDGAVRMQALISTLLDYSRVGTQSGELREIDLESILSDVMATLRATIDTEGATVTHDRLPRIWGDPVQMGQLLQNLIGNALKFHGEQPARVHVTAARVDAGWQFSVIDHGIGIDPEYGDRIFVIFERLHSRHEYPGTGIGLAICKRIVERHQGRIWVQTAPDGGAIFHFTIPDRGEAE